jgi:hypothetical protein
LDLCCGCRFAPPTDLIAKIVSNVKTGGIRSTHTLTQVRKMQCPSQSKKNLATLMTPADSLDQTQRHTNSVVMLPRSKHSVCSRNNKCCNWTTMLVGDSFEVDIEQSLMLLQRLYPQRTILEQQRRALDTKTL